MIKYDSIEEMGDVLLDVFLNIDCHGPDSNPIEDIKFQIHVAVLKDMSLTDEEWLLTQENASGDEPQSRASLLNDLYYNNVALMTSQVFAYASIKQRHWSGIKVANSDGLRHPWRGL